MVGFTNRRQILSRRLSENITIVSLHLERKYLSLSEVLPRVGGKGAVCSIESLKEIIFLPCSKFRCSIMFSVKVLFNSRDISLSLKSILEISLVCSLEVNYRVSLFPSLVRI